MLDAALIAQNLARNCGYAVFPVAENKSPTRPKSEGGEGYKDATTDPDRIAWLWENWPGPLIGIATGKASDISVLDVDQKHREARQWWQANHYRLLPTRTFESRSGGLHLYFRHVEGVTCTTNKLCTGIDTRGAGGFIISWFAAGFACLDHFPPEPWPAWLLAELTRPAEPAPRKASSHGEVGHEGIIRRVEAAQEGERNAVLFWAANRLAERGMSQAEAEALLLPAAAAAGLAKAAEQKEAKGSIASAYRRAA